MEDPGKTPTLLDRASCPPGYPTHLHSTEFWEQLGRAIATYSFLEDVLGRAIYAATATKVVHDDADKQKALGEWERQLEKAVTNTLKPLADAYLKVARDNPAWPDADIADLVVKLKAASETRNMLCHASWQPPDQEGASLPRFINRNSGMIESKVDVAFLKAVQVEVAQLAMDVMDTVTRTGWRFPGTEGPGRPIERSD